MSNFAVVDGDIRLTTSGGGQLLHTDDQNRLKVVMDMIYAPHTLSGTDHTGQLSNAQVTASNVTQHESFIDHDNLLNYDLTEHRILNDGSETDINLWSAQKISSEITTATGSLTTDHGELTGLSDDDHTQYHNDTRGDVRYYTQTQLNNGQLDNRYYTESEVDALTWLESDVTDLDKYTQAEVDTISGSLSSEIDSDISTHASSSDHDGRYYTETESDANFEPKNTNIQTHISSTSNPHSVDEGDILPSQTGNSGKVLGTNGSITSWVTQSGGGGAVDSVFSRTGDVVAAQDDYTHSQLGSIGANDHHAESHTVASHSDTTATGAELDTLTDNSIANALHGHSELVASDGSPDPALSIDSIGSVETNGQGILINSLGSGNRLAYLDLVGDDTYNYGVRITRNASGANSVSQIEHRGTGGFIIKSTEAALIQFQTNGANARMSIAADGKVSLETGTSINEFSTDGTFTGDSDDAVPTEKAVKTYVDTVSGTLSGAGGGLSNTEDNVWSETQLYDDNSLTCSSTTTWDMETYQNTYLLLTENTTLSGIVPTENSGYYTCLIENGGTYTLTLDNQFLTSEGEDLSFTTISGAIDILGVYLNNGSLYASLSTNFS